MKPAHNRSKLIQGLTILLTAAASSVLLGFLLAHGQYGALGSAALVLAGMAVPAVVMLFQRRSLCQLDAECEQLRRAETWYRQIIEFSPDGMLIVDADGSIIVANPKAHDLFGYPAGNLIGRDVDELVPADIRPRHAAMRARFNNCADGHLHLGKVAGSVRAARLDGSEFPIELGLTHLSDQDGGKACTCVTVRDVTQHKTYEQTIADQLTFQRTLLNTLPHPMFFKDDKGCYLGFNQAFLDAFGIERETLLGKNVLQFMQVPAEERPIYHAANQRVLREGGTFTAEMRLPYADGKVHDVLYSLSGHRGSDNKTAGLVGALIDISAQKQAEQAQLEAKLLAEEATRLKSDFLANMSHEIRTPMNVIMGMAHLALDSPLSPRQRNYLEKIHTASETLLGIINDILDFSKIEAGKLQFEEIDFFLEDVLGNLADLGTAKAQERGLELLFDIGMDVPTSLRGDPLRLGQVLNNLLGNALKFTTRGEITITIRRERTADDSVWLHFAVRDTGIGIDEEQRQRLFHAFTQADTSTSRKYGGTGLGLAICKRLVELMGGRLGVDSEPGIGSTFHFRAPFRLQSRQRRLEISSEDILGMRVLIVDDNTNARDILQGMLHALKFDADTAADAASAIAMLEKACAAGRPYRLVLMDWMMPGINGVEAVRQIRAHSSIDKTPCFVMVTAFSRDELHESLGDLPVAGLLEKPVTPSTLLDGILGAFGTAERHQPRKKVMQAELVEAQRALRGTHLLLVEDNTVNQEMGIDILGRNGIRVDVAGNGADALALIAHTRYDAVLMDCQMPVMDGFEATRRIRAMEGCAELPVIAMTANAMSGDRERCLAAGMNDHISKPIDVQQLFIRLHQWIGSSARQSSQPADLPDSRGNAITLPAIPDLRLEAAMQRLGGDNALLQTLLRRFCDTQSDASARISQALAENDKDGAVRIAHTLKGLAGNIGAEALAVRAADIDNRLRNGQDTDAALRGLADALATLSKDIQEALARHPSSEPAAATAVDATPAWLDELRAGLQQLETMLRTDDGESGRHLQALAPALDRLDQPDRVERLRDLVALYRFDEALDGLDALRRACPDLVVSPTPNPENTQP